jgi:hypothetical protein
MIDIHEPQIRPGATREHDRLSVDRWIRKTEFGQDADF